MGLFQKACETYDTFASLAGVPQEGKSTLLPISHIMQKAQIEITLDLDGNFVRAVLVDPKLSKTVIPATIESAGRTGKSSKREKVKTAHPLSDQLEYVSSLNPEKHEDYINKLSSWANSEFTHTKVHAVLSYVKKDSILHDLQREGIIRLKSDGKPDKGKINNADYSKCMIRWRILNTGTKDACWEDASLINAYIQYYKTTLEKSDVLCLITGNKTVPLKNHPKGIIAAQYGAKLISSNDKDGFTFRGRFETPDQAATISYEASQKAHYALQWLADKNNQGVEIAGRTFLCWNPQGKKLYNFYTSELLFGSTASEIPPKPTEYKEKLRKTLAGYRNELPETAEVILAAFDAATTGRLSLTYYNELRASDFYDRIERWYATCSWPYWLKEKGELVAQSPLLINIVKYAFGTERGKNIDLEDKIKRDQTQRLVSCVTDGMAIPMDLVKALGQRASQPLAYDKKNNNYRKVLFTACAVIRKYRNDKLKREEWTLALQEDKLDRSYQYGRLLAVLEKVEQIALEEKEKDRETTAMRLMSAYRNQPRHYSVIIHESIQKAYMPIISPGKRKWFKKLIQDIFMKLSEFPDSEQNKPLEDTYLMGYYLQRQALYSNKNFNEKQEEE